MNLFYQFFIPFLVAFLATVWIYPKVLHIAKIKNIVDNPDARKLQKTPVPVLGGASVYFGLTAGALSVMPILNCTGLYPIFGALTIVLVIGIIDDIIGLSPRLRFFIEIMLVLFLIYASNMTFIIDNFHGLWGLHIIPVLGAIILTVVASVGIINAINLIDGVDGYSSGYCIVASAVFGVYFFLSGNTDMVILSALSIGALLPFFFHNVFGKNSKMFIGDGGTLVMGVVMSAFVTNTVSSNTPNWELTNNIGLVPFTLAVLCIPVFDTLRVMSTRMLRGKSPFYPDKTHLHHMFIELGFSHIGTTITIIITNILVVAIWYFAYKIGASVDTQLYIVVALGLLVTFGFYSLMQLQKQHNTKLYKIMLVLGSYTHFERKGLFCLLRTWMDRSSGSEKEQAAKTF